MPDIITTAAASRRERYGISNNHDDLFLMGYLGKEWNVWVLGMSCMKIVEHGGTYICIYGMCPYHCGYTSLSARVESFNQILIITTPEACKARICAVPLGLISPLICTLRDRQRTT